MGLFYFFFFLERATSCFLPLFLIISPFFFSLRSCLRVAFPPAQPTHLRPALAAHIMAANRVRKRQWYLLTTGPYLGCIKKKKKKSRGINHGIPLVFFLFFLVNPLKASSLSPTRRKFVPRKLSPSVGAPGATLRPGATPPSPPSPALCPQATGCPPHTGAAPPGCHKAEKKPQVRHDTSFLFLFFFFFASSQRKTRAGGLRTHAFVQRKV